MQARRILGILFPASLVLAAVLAASARESAENNAAKEPAAASDATPPSDNNSEANAQNNQPGDQPEEPSGMEPNIQDFKDNYAPLEFRPLRGNRAEYVDLGVMAVLLTVGAWMVVRHVRSRWLLALLCVGLLYLGFWRGGCVCPIGAASDVCYALFHPDWVGRAALWFFLLPLVFALLAGRVFCGTVCPLGAIQHLLVRRSRPLVLPKWLDRGLMLGPIVVLAAIVWNSIQGPSFLVCRLDPFATAFLFGKASLHHLASPAASVLPAVGNGVSWAILCGSLVLCTVVALPFCRYVCPFGVLLGLASLVAFKRRALDHSRCGVCGRCKRACPTQAIAGHRRTEELRVNSYKCVQCGRCDDACQRQIFVHGRVRHPKQRHSPHP